LKRVGWGLRETAIVCKKRDGTRRKVKKRTDYCKQEKIFKPARGGVAKGSLPHLILPEKRKWVGGKPILFIGLIGPYRREMQRAPGD